MIDMVQCQICGAPNRKLWPPVESMPRFESQMNGNYISLEKCIKCNILWCSSPYEPYLSFIYIVRWSLSKENWVQLHKIDEGETLRRWHICTIRELWTQLSPQEKEIVNWHRKRIHSLNPVDGLYQGKKPMLKELLDKDPH